MLVLVGMRPAGWPQGTQTTRHATRTSTRPPPFSTSTPCPYRTEAGIPNHSPIRLAKIIRGLSEKVIHTPVVLSVSLYHTWTPAPLVRRHMSIGRSSEAVCKVVGKTLANVTLRHGSKERDSSSPPARSSPVILRFAQDLCSETSLCLSSQTLSCAEA